MSGRVIVVTGGAGGIGLATCAAFDGLGDTVYVVDIAEAEGSAVADNLQRGHFLHCDVTSVESIAGCVTELSEIAGKVDVLVNNAGGFPTQRTVEETSLEEWRATIDLNLTSVFLVSRACLPLLRESEAGRIINIGSLAAQLSTYRTSPSYSAAKAGVHALTRVLASELAGEGITVNALSPSAVMTDRIRDLRGPEERAATAASIPLGRYQTPEELASWVVFLASTQAGFMTGQTVSVNGGRFMV